LSDGPRRTGCPACARHDHRGNMTSHSRGSHARALHLFAALLGRGRREDRVPARHPWAVARKSRAKARRPQVTAENTPAFPARWCYGLYRALLGEPAFATVASFKPLEHEQSLAPASGRQNHTTSPSANAPLVSRHIRVHRIPHSTLVTIAIAPLQSRRDGARYTVNQNFWKEEYFCV
jgi:hypothetical protein